MPHLPNPQLESGYLVQKRKPESRARFEIDWNHSLAQGLYYYVLLNEGVGAPFDLVQKQFWTSSSPNDWAIQTGGTCLEGSKTVNDEWNAPVSFAQAAGAKITVATGVRHNGSLTSFEFMFGLDGSDYRNSISVQTTAAPRYEFFFEQGNSTINSPPVANVDTVNIFSVADNTTSENAKRMWINGVNYLNTTPGKTADTTSFTPRIMRSSFGGRSWNGWIYWWAMWYGRVFDDGEAMALSQDPYCFLIPA